MSEDFLYERIKIADGIKLEIITGGSRYKGKLWRELAMQIYCESGKGDYREIGHFSSGAPFLYGEDERISISHTEGCLVVATIKTSPESDLSIFSPATALGVDVEHSQREKVMTVRERFLSDRETGKIDAKDVKANVTAWTCKEAMLKAGMKNDINWVSDLTVIKLPTENESGYGEIDLEGETFEMKLHTLHYDGFVITVAR